MKKMLLILLALSVMFLYVTTVMAGNAETVQGWVSDTKCAAKGASAAHADCAKKCMQAGAKLAIVTDADQKVLTVANGDALAGHEGHHVEVKGEVSGDSITVDKDSIKMLDAAGGN